MRKYIVEKEFDYNGLKCVITFSSNGHRCGYVGIDNEHCLYGKDYDEKINSDSNIEEYFDCHGGITYAGGGHNSEYPIKSNLWWFGFDCMHYGDKRDYATAKQLFSNDKEIIATLEWCEESDHSYAVFDEKCVRTLEFVVEECKKLANQLCEVKNQTINQAISKNIIEIPETGMSAIIKDWNGRI